MDCKKTYPLVTPKAKMAKPPTAAAALTVATNKFRIKTVYR